MKRLLSIFLILLLAGCGTSNQNGDIAQTTITAYILELGDRILVNEKITAEEMKTKTKLEIHDEYYWSSMFVSTQNVDQSIVSKLEVGQKVRIVIEGGIAESAPSQATASKIEIVEE